MCSGVYFEMPAEESNRLTAFYQEAFGWKVQKPVPEIGNHIIVTTAEWRRDFAGAMNRGFSSKKPD